MSTYKKLAEKQKELINEYEKLVNLCLAPQYHEIIKAKRIKHDYVIALESELSALEAEIEKEEPMDELQIDLIQYVTNLLYAAANEGPTMGNPKFDEWVDKEMFHLSEYYDAQFKSQSLPKDELLNEAIELLQYFVTRVEEGSIRSKTTYGKYKIFLEKIKT